MAWLIEIDSWDVRHFGGYARMTSWMLHTMSDNWRSVVNGAQPAFRSVPATIDRAARTGRGAGWPSAVRASDDLGMVTVSIPWAERLAGRGGTLAVRAEDLGCT